MKNKILLALLLLIVNLIVYYFLTNLIDYDYIEIALDFIIVFPIGILVLSLFSSLFMPNSTKTYKQKVKYVYFLLLNMFYSVMIGIALLVYLNLKYNIMD